MPLTDLTCRNAKPGERPRKLADAGGLYLLVQPNGSRLWRLNYRFDGKQKTLAFGKYPEVTLNQARARRDEAKALLGEGFDPARPPARTEGDDGPTFREVAEEWLTVRGSAWKPRHQVTTAHRIKKCLYPDLGDRPLALIDAPLILDTLRKVEARDAFDIAKRMRQSCSAIFRYAIATGRASRDPAADLRGALKSPPRTERRAWIREKELPEFFRRLRAYDGHGLTRDALEFIVHTFVRTNELRGARWEEFEGDLWRIPAGRMKGGLRDHLVPLSPEALAILARLRGYRMGDFVAPLSENTMLYALYRMGYHSRATTHGFRTTASTILNESGLWSPDAIERQLAHVPGNDVRAAYNAAEYLPERRRMMAWYSKRLMEQENEKAPD